MSILSVEHLTKVYGTGTQAVRALDDVSLTLEAGEFVAIIGSSGSGKSTLMHLMGGVDRPTSGTVRLGGDDIYAHNDEQLAVFRRREVGLIYQFYNLIPVLDVQENMTLPVQLDGRKVNQQRLDMLLDSLRLRGREHHLPNQLSGGQQQRVAIGRALMNAPAIVLADEPTGNLDSATGEQVLQTFERLRERGKTIVLITHDASVAARADRTVHILDGKIQQGAFVGAGTVGGTLAPHAGTSAPAAVPDFAATPVPPASTAPAPHATVPHHVPEV